MEWHMKKTASALAALLAVAAAACSGDSPTGTDSGPSGVYVMRSAGGADLPFLIADDGYCVQSITGGSLDFKSSKDVTVIFVYTTVCDGTVTDVQDGPGMNLQYTYSKGNIVITWQGQPQFTATLQGSTIELFDGDIIFVFSR
jgi:hypothetical protein